MTLLFIPLYTNVNIWIVYYEKIYLCDIMKVI